MKSTISKNNRTLTLLGWTTGVLSLLFLVAFQYTGNKVDNYYFLGAFFTALNVAVLCLCFSQVYNLLGAILDELKQKQ